MLLTLLSLLLSISMAWTEETRHEFTVKAVKDSELSVRAFYYTNSYGSKEVRLESPHLPRINDRINAIYGYGRDTDEDSIIDTWFMLDPKVGFRIIEGKCKDELCSSMIQEKIFKRIEFNAKDIIYSGYAGVVGYIFSALNNRNLKEIEYFREWVDLTEMKLIIKREMNSKKPIFSPNEIAASLQAINYGLEQNQEMLSKAHGIDNLKYSALDGALVGVAGTLMKFLSKGLAPLVKKFDNLQIAANSKTLNAIKITSQTQYQKVLRGGLLSFKHRTRLLNRLGTIKNVLTIGLKNGAAGWKYIGMSAGIQLSAEIAANYDSLKDDDPLIMAKNVMNDEDIQQNIAYMTTETFMMTAAVTSISNVKAKFAVCAFIAFTNSTIMNLFIKDDVDPNRIKLDTAWEAGVGSTQVYLDNAAINFFHTLAENPRYQKLKHLGYAVALVDQGAGYYGYSKAAKWVEGLNEKQEKPEPEIMLLPILVNN